MHGVHPMTCCVTVLHVQDGSYLAIRNSFLFGPLFTFHMVFAFVKKYIAFALPSRRDEGRNIRI